MLRGAEVYRWRTSEFCLHQAAQKRALSDSQILYRRLPARELLGDRPIDRAVSQPMISRAQIRRRGIHCMLTKPQKAIRELRENRIKCDHHPSLTVSLPFDLTGDRQTSGVRT